MTSTYNISLTAKTAHHSGADLDVWTGRADSAGFAMRGATAPRTATVETSRTANLDALAARCAG
ncbi:MAG TPA: hypothetical protein VHW96_20135 [Solirubrobacteraceae bacterium]|jgi:hypothetical protein|nr:hypothetical protein [Solirubrobacteraceae bacterium]